MAMSRNQIRRAGRSKKAQKAGGKTTPQKAYLMAVRAMRDGDRAQALAMCAQILSFDPMHLDAQHLNASLSFQEGQVEQAIGQLRNLLSLKPDHAQALCDLGAMLHANGQYGEAEGPLNEALRLSPKMAGAHLNLGNVQRATGRTTEAEKSYLAALRHQPGMARALGNLSLVQLQLGQAEDAAKTARKAIKLHPKYDGAYTRLGNALDRLGQRDEAFSAHQAAVDLKPERISARMAFAHSFSGYGKMEDAKAVYRSVIAQAPRHVTAHVALAGLVKYHERAGKELAQMEQLAAQQGLTEKDYSALAFALGKVYEQCGAHKEAFEQFVKANVLTRKSISYDPATSEALFRAIKSGFGHEIIEKFDGSGHQSDQPIFVIGMPRSGTTLVEQILSSHADVSGAGELPGISNFARDLTGNDSAPNFQNALSNFDRADWKKRAEDYLRLSTPFGHGAKHIIDKMPGNFLYVGLIRLMFPNAKIIHCRRNALDCCLSIFKNSFTVGGHQHAYDMAELGHYHLLYQDLMQFWDEVLPEPLYVVDYEKMVADQAGQSRALLAACGLDWSDDVLNYYNTAKPVHTISIAQVRQPIYSSSVGIHKKYGDALAPLMEALKV